MPRVTFLLTPNHSVLSFFVPRRYFVSLSNLLYFQLCASLQFSFFILLSLYICSLFSIVGCLSSRIKLNKNNPFPFFNSNPSIVTHLTLTDSIRIEPNTYLFIRETKKKKEKTAKFFFMRKQNCIVLLRMERVKD